MPYIFFQSRQLPACKGISCSATSNKWPSDIRMGISTIEGDCANGPCPATACAGTALNRISEKIRRRGGGIKTLSTELIFLSLAARSPCCAFRHLGRLSGQSIKPGNDQATTWPVVFPELPPPTNVTSTVARNASSFIFKVSCACSMAVENVVKPGSLQVKYRELWYC